MVTAFVVMFAVALVFVCGLVLDGGRLLAASRQTNNIADSAARAGAQGISDEAVRAGDAIVLDPAIVHDKACAFLLRAGHSCSGDASVNTEGNEVTVTITDSVDVLMLPLGAQSITGTGSACVARGITGDEATAQC
jgi:Flp pilus assembly protein TadG